MIKRNIALAKLATHAIRRWPKPVISRVNLQLTTQCNHRCVSCDIWKGNHDALTLHDVQRLIASNHLMWVSLTGGEPSLNTHFPEIVSLCNHFLPLTNIITNGQLPGRITEAIGKAERRNMMVVHISLFGDRETHDRMAGINGSYDAAVTTACKLQELGGNLIVGFEHMISQHNPYGWWHVAELSKTLDVGLTYVVEQRAGFYHNESKSIKPMKLPPTTFGLKPTDIFKNMFLNRLDRKTKCVAGQYSCFITADKMVYPCLFAIPDRPAFTLNGDYTLDGRFGGVQEYIKHCPGCWTPCESYTTTIFRPWRLIG